MPRFLILTRRISPGISFVNSYFRVSSNFFSQKTAILSTGKPEAWKFNGIARRGTKSHRRIRRNVGFLLLEFGSLRKLSCPGPGRYRMSSVICPQAVDNYGSLGVCEPRPAAEDQRAPGRLDRTTVL